jgi:hypothetical protein
VVKTEAHYVVLEETKAVKESVKEQVSKAGEIGADVQVSSETAGAD